MVFIQSLPQELSTSLALNTTNPNLISALTSGYTHIGVSHLTNNLYGYFLVMPFILFLSFRRKGLVDYSLIALFLLVPLIYSSCSTIMFGYYGKSLIDKGFSTILSSLFAYLPVCYIFMLEEVEGFKFKNRNNLIMLIFIINIFFISIIYRALHNRL